MNARLSSLVNIIIATSVASLFSLVGIYALSLKEKTLHSILLVLVAFSAGSILGAAYFDLLPEAIELFKGVRCVRLHHLWVHLVLLP